MAESFARVRSWSVEPIQEEVYDETGYCGVSGPEGYAIKLEIVASLDVVQRFQEFLKREGADPVGVGSVGPPQLPPQTSRRRPMLGR